jgi:putative SOS response-associated peptidase YedK
MEVPSSYFAISTVPSNELVSQIHDRMPAIIELSRQMKGGFANAQFQVRQVRMEQGNS